MENIFSLIIPGSVEEVIDTLTAGEEQLNVYPVISVPPSKGTLQYTTIELSISTTRSMVGLEGGTAVGIIALLGRDSAEEPIEFVAVITNV